MAIDEWESGCKRLGQAHGGVIDRAISVRVQLTHDLTDDSGALHVTLIWAQTHIEHLMEDATLDRLETVTGIREST
jgi:hypothetical protein